MDQTGSCRLLREEQRIMKYYKTPGFDEMNQFLRMNQFFAQSKSGKIQTFNMIHQLLVSAKYLY